MQQSDGLLRREKMTEEEWEQETYKAVVTAIGGPGTRHAFRRFGDL
jgi:hypothetical protein